jgi:hypothetical protein
MHYCHKTHSYKVQFGSSNRVSISCIFSTNKSYDMPSFTEIIYQNDKSHYQRLT